MCANLNGSLLDEILPGREMWSARFAVQWLTTQQHELASNRNSSTITGCVRWNRRANLNGSLLDEILLRGKMWSARCATQWSTGQQPTAWISRTSKVGAISSKIIECWYVKFVRARSCQIVAPVVLFTKLRAGLAMSSVNWHWHNIELTCREFITRQIKCTERREFIFKIVTCNFIWLFEDFFLEIFDILNNLTFSKRWQFDILDTINQHSQHDNPTFSTHR